LKTVEYESVADLVRDAQKNPDPNKSAFQKGDNEWYGSSFECAVERSVIGWPKGRDRVLALRAEIEEFVKDTINSAAHDICYDVSGNWVDIGRYMTGEPDCCGYERQADWATVQERVAKIVVNVSAMADVDKDAIFSAGAAAVAAIDICEALGKRCEVWIGSGSKCKDNDKELQVLVLAKAANQPVDIDRLSFLFCHAGVLRRLLFSVEEDFGFAPNRSKTTKLDVPDAVVTPEVRGSDSTVEKRRKRALSVCRSLGISVTGLEHVT